MAFYFSSVTKALYDTDVFPVASLPENKVEITEAAYTDLMTKQNQGYVILADGTGNPYTVNQSEATATDIKHAASVATTLALGHVKIGNTMQAANDGTINVKDGAVGTSKLADDSVTASKVKDNETLPVNVSGNANFLHVNFKFNNRGDQTSNRGLYHKIFTITTRGGYQQESIGLLCSVCVKCGGLGYRALLSIDPSNPSYSRAFRIGGEAPLSDFLSFYFDKSVLNEIGSLWVNTPNTNDYTIDLTVLNASGFGIVEALNTDTSNTEPTGKFGSSQVGSPGNPVYVGSDGQVQPCDRPTIIDKIVNEDGTDIVISKTITINDSSTFYTLGKLNITPSNKERIVDFTFMLERYTSLDSQNLRTNNKLIFCVFVGNTEVNRFLLTPSVDQDLFQSFRCSFTANINNTIYIKVKRATTLEPRSADFFYPKVQGLIM